jgi:hypothetical protein
MHLGVSGCTRLASTLPQATGFGVGVQETTITWADDKVVLSHEYQDQLQTEEDVQKIRAPEVRLEEAATASVEARAHEIFDGILDVQMQGWIPSFELWDDIATWRGVEVVLLDLIDRPAHMHEIARRYTAARLGMLDQLEAKRVARLRPAPRPLRGARTDELPAFGFDPARPRTKDNWTCPATLAQAQALGSVPGWRRSATALIAAA